MQDETEVCGSLAIIVGVAGWVRGYWKDWMSCGTGSDLITERPRCLDFHTKAANEE